MFNFFIIIKLLYHTRVSQRTNQIYRFFFIFMYIRILLLLLLKKLVFSCLFFKE